MSFGDSDKSNVMLEAKSPQESLLLKILQIGSPHQDRRSKGPMPKRSNNVERVLLIGCDLAEIYSPDTQKLQILSIFMDPKE
jgi:hypothetical protein